MGKTIVMQQINELRKNAALKKNAVKKIKEMVAENRLPKIVKLMHQMYPNLDGELIDSTLKVLYVTQNIDELTRATQGYMSRQERSVRYGCEWELPYFIARGLVYDLCAGIDVDNPTREDLQNSEVFRVAIIYQCPKSKVKKFIESLTDLPDAVVSETEPEITFEEAVANLHPIARKQWDNRSKGVYHIEGYEILSEVLKEYSSLSEWNDDSWERRHERVPELHYYNVHGKLDLDCDIQRILK